MQLSATQLNATAHSKWSNLPCVRDTCSWTSASPDARPHQVRSRVHLARRPRPQQAIFPNVISQTLNGRHKVREVRDDDEDGLVSLQAAAFYEPMNIQWMDNFLSKYFEVELRAIVKSKLKGQVEESRFQAFVAESRQSQSKVAGVVEVSVQNSMEVIQALGATAGETYAYIACMAVAEDARRQGIAIQLLKAAERQALKWDQHIATLHVYKTNDIAFKVYTKAGYEPLKKDNYVQSLFGKTRILMVKELKAK